MKKLNFKKMQQDYESHELWLKQDPIFVARHDMVRAGERKRAQTAQRIDRLRDY